MSKWDILLVMNLSRNETRAIWFVLFLSFLFITLSFVFSEYQIVQIRSALSLQIPVSTGQPLSQSVSQLTSDNCGASCQAYINQAVNQALLPNSASPKASSVPVVVQQQTQTKTTQVTYFPLSGGSTPNTDWTNINSSSFTFNIGDYGSNPYVIWDANLRVDNGSGTTYARLFDVTHGIAVNGSQIYISATSISTDVVSGSLSFWQGSNNYVVQVKSLNGSTAFVDSARIKISY